MPISVRGPRLAREDLWNRLGRSFRTVRQDSPSDCTIFYPIVRLTQCHEQRGYNSERSHRTSVCSCSSRSLQDRFQGYSGRILNLFLVPAPSTMSWSRSIFEIPRNQCVQFFGKVFLVTIAATLIIAATDHYLLRPIVPANEDSEANGDDCARRREVDLVVLVRVMRCIGHEVARADLVHRHPAPSTRQLLEISSYRVELIIEIGDVDLLERPAQICAQVPPAHHSRAPQLMAGSERRPRRKQWLEIRCLAPGEYATEMQAWAMARADCGFRLDGLVRLRQLFRHRRVLCATELLGGHLSKQRRHVLDIGTDGIDLWPVSCRGLLCFV